MKELIEFLESRGLYNDDFKKDNTLLNLGYTKIDDSGVKELAEVLKHNFTVTALYLDYSGINDKGVKELAEMLKVNTTLTTLGLSNNNISNLGAMELLEVLKFNSTVSISVYQNNIGKSEKNLIDSYSQRNKNLAERKALNTKFLENDQLQKLSDELSNKIINNITINTKDKTIILDTIQDILQKAKFFTSKIYIKQIESSFQELLDSKPTKAKVMKMEEDIDNLIEQQTITIFNESINKLNYKIANDTTINIKDKAIIEDTMVNITDKAKKFNNIIELEKIITFMQKLFVGQPKKIGFIMAAELIDNCLIEQQNDDISLAGSDATFG